MTDPCWLPSAIMQTTGAMLGIYVGIYILVIQQHFKAKEVLEGGEKAQKASYAFYGLIVTCGATIIFNALWLDSLSTHSIFETSFSRPLGLLATCLFLASVLLICGYSIAITVRVNK